MTTLHPTQHNQPPRQPPVASFRVYVSAFSRPYLVHDSIRISVLTDEGVKGFIIPRSRSVPHIMDCVDLLSDPNFINSAHVGYDRAVVYNVPPNLAMLQYAWPDELSVSSRKSTIQAPYSSLILLDSSSSRIVIRAMESVISVVDLAAI